MREVAGLGQFASIAEPSIKKELPAITQMLVGQDEGDPYVRPKGDKAAIDAAWLEWDGTLEWLRVLFELPEGGSFQSSFEGLLTPREVLALPGMTKKLRYIGGDAAGKDDELTEPRIFAMDFGNRTYIMIETEKLLGPLRGLPTKTWEGEAEIIAVGELLVIVVLAAQNGPDWEEQLIFGLTDNDNVKDWIKKRKAKNAVARHLLRALALMEARWKFRLLVFYIRTYHNELADYGTRAAKEAVRRRFSIVGWKEINPPDDWDKIIWEAGKHLMKIPGDEEGGKTAWQVKTGSEGATPMCKAVDASGLVMLEVGSISAPFARAWKALGGKCWIGQWSTQPAWLKQAQDFSIRRTKWTPWTRSPGSAHRCRKILQAPSCEMSRRPSRWANPRASCLTHPEGSTKKRFAKPWKRLATTSWSRTRKSAALTSVTPLREAGGSLQQWRRRRADGILPWQSEDPTWRQEE